MRIVLLLLVVGLMAQARTVYRNGYWTKRGYVRGHLQTTPDKNPYNNLQVKK